MNENTNEMLKVSRKDKSKSVREKFFSFNGRVSRKNFWLRNLVLGSISFIIYLALNTTNEYQIVLAGLLVNFILWMSSLSLSIRRWHDLNKSGFYIFSHIFLIPIVYCAFKRGTVGINKYGKEDI